MPKINYDAFYFALQMNYDHLKVRRIDEKTFKIGRKEFQVTKDFIYYRGKAIKYSGRPTGLIQKIWDLGICRPYIGFYFLRLNGDTKCLSLFPTFV